MKAIMVMYDSMNRHMLPNHGCDWTLAPNFSRLAERVVTFDNHYVGSMPCMPARREIHTGRLNFLHRSWSPTMNGLHWCIVPLVIGLVLGEFPADVWV